MESNEKFNRGELGEGEGVEDEETKAMNKKIDLQMRQDELQERGRKKDFLNRMMKDRSRAEQEDLLRREQEARELKILQAQHERKLGEELLRRKNADIVEQKRRQLLRKDSIELRRLEDQLRNSYAANAARVQLFQREVFREKTKMRKIEEARKIRAWYQNDSFEEQQMLEARQRKEQYRRDLQDQLVLNHRLRQQKTEETRRERKLVEEVSEVLRLEDLENQRSKRETAARLLAEERVFFEAREMWKLKEHQRLLKEHEEHTRILADKINEQKQSDDAKAAAVAGKEAMLEKMSRKMLDDESKKREREDMANELIAAEERSNLENRQRNAALEKNVVAKGLLDDFRRQKLAIEERKVREAEADRAFADYLARERDKSVVADKRKEEERRARGIEYGKALKEAIAAKSIDYATKILENETMQSRDRKLDEARRISIEEERSRMLEEHERRLRGLLKPGRILSEPQASANKAPSPCNY